MVRWVIPTVCTLTAIPLTALSPGFAQSVASACWALWGIAVGISWSVAFLRGGHE